ncbi:MAG: glycerol-3-phosphate dehydrogenase/oxidase [Planctomycetaceae bacterium]
MSESSNARPVLILGAGINGCALARELVLNGVPVILVDQADIATGATAKSSRLIHGGLRYLEYGDFRLVAESLAERERMLRLAPQFVRPLKLSIPVSRRFGGFLQSAVRFLRLSRFPVTRRIAALVPAHAPRGLIVVRIGLWLYDWIARSSLLPGHRVRRVGEPGAPSVDAATFHWVCSYYDAQMPFPERFVLALLEDARQAAETGVDFQVLPYHQAEFRGRTAEIRPLTGNGLRREFEPAAVINATGAWGDLTLKAMGVDTEPLFGGTKGSHLITTHAGLRRALGDGGVYAEAADGRLVFILPFGESVLVGTTDERFRGPPGEAVATEQELEYLIGMVNEVFPKISLTRKDVHLHYCGVRPLPRMSSGRTGSIPRGHWIHSSVNEGMRIETLIGGKLTTCRAFAEEAADRVFELLGLLRTRDTRDRLIPGAEEYPADVKPWCAALADETGYSAEQVEAVFLLIGTRAREVLTGGGPLGTSCSIPGTDLPICFVDRVIAEEWVSTLGDLVERRLGLIFTTGLSRDTLEVLADRLCLSGIVTAESRDREISDCLTRLQERYGIAIPPPAEGPVP